MAEASRPIVLEFARSPVPGRAKTRLARTEGDVEAARIYRLLAEDVHGTLMDAQAEGRADVALCLPPGDEAWLEGAHHAWSQGEGDLGTKLARCFGRAFEEGASAVLAVGTDVVGLSAGVLGRAFDRLEEADIVFAPAADGGYGLIGMRARNDTVFEGIPWGTASVASDTRRRAREAGLRLSEIHGLDDVDVAADLDGAVPLLSILVPVLDEAPRLRTNLPALMAQVEAAGEHVEVLVVDGGSSDDSVAVARSAGAEVLSAPRGRGIQLQRAAEAARGRWLWTVHADARPAEGAVEGAIRFCRSGAKPWGFAPTHIEHPSRLLRVVNTFATYRAALLRLPYGDQGILVKRAVFDHVGGYERVPLMEDVLLAGRLRRYGPPGRVPARLYVDARRWRHYGVARTTWRNWTTIIRFLVFGTDARSLAAGYDRGSSG